MSAAITHALNIAYQAVLHVAKVALNQVHGEQYKVNHLLLEKHPHENSQLKLLWQSNEVDSVRGKTSN